MLEHQDSSTSWPWIFAHKFVILTPCVLHNQLSYGNNCTIFVVYMPSVNSVSFINSVRFIVTQPENDLFECICSSMVFRESADYFIHQTSFQLCNRWIFYLQQYLRIWWHRSVSSGLHLAMEIEQTCHISLLNWCLQVLDYVVVCSSYPFSSSIAPTVLGISVTLRYGQMLSCYMMWMSGDSELAICWL